MGQKENNIPVSGMSDAHPMNIKENQYPLMLNGNIQTDVTAGVTLTNEHSNILCNNFPTGCIVIGTLYAPEEQVTFVWLTNPNDNHASDQIGYLSEYSFTDVNDFPVKNPCNDCAGKNEEETPLELRSQNPICNYTLITHATCLNFNISNPVRSGVLKKDNCGLSIYYTDNLNPPRYLRMNLDLTLNSDQALITGYTQSNCPQPIYTDPTESDCLKILVFPQTSHICVTPISINPGGSLGAGTYQLAACYAAKTGERATRTFSCSNPISVFDKNQTLTSESAYPTDKAVKFTIGNLNKDEYAFIDLFVVATLNSVTSVKQLPTVNITSITSTSLDVLVSDFERGVDVTLDDILQIFDVYETADSCTSAANLLLWSNLSGPKDLNLQQAVIGLSPTVRWVTSEAKENLYADGAAAALYRGYLRDEVYPLGIVFERNNTLNTCVYPLVGRNLNVAFTADYNFTGEWIPTRAYTASPISDVVLVSGVYYNAISDNINNQPPSTDWAILTPTFGPGGNICVQDDTTITGHDVLTFPGCDSKRPANSLNWEVYNTACNYGQVCSPIKAKLACTAYTDTVKCTSFVYQYVAWNNTSSYEAGDVVTYLGILYTAAIANTGVIPPTAGTWVTGSSGCTPSDCYIDLANNCLPCTSNYPTLISNVRHSTAWNNATQYYAPTTYSNSTTYTANQLVIFNSNIYTSLAGGNTGHQPDLAVNTGVWWKPGGSASIVNDGTDNYQALIDNININLSDDTVWFKLGSYCAASWPTTILNSCVADHVRTRSDALNYYGANGKYLLCVDSTLANLPSTLSDPYAYLSNIHTVKVAEASNKKWCKYNLSDIYSVIPKTGDPTQAWTIAPGSTTDLGCLGTYNLLNHTPIKQWLVPDINTPTTPPTNNSPTSGVASFNPSPQGLCNDYGPSAPLMYMFGRELIAPTQFPCSGCTDCDPNNWGWAGAGTTADFWGVGPTVPTNNTPYESYWYSFTSTSTQPTIIIKSKIFYKFGDLLPPSGVTLPALVGGLTYQMQPGDIRIDVYQGSATGPLVYSSGDTSAQFYYTSTDADTGVLVIGDVANSTGQTTAAGQLPLIAGTQYFVHIYALPNALTKLNVSPIPNTNKTSNCVSPTSGSCCPCYFGNYAWLNLCMNSSDCADTDKVTVKIPETWEQQCTYTIFYQDNELNDPGCTIQTYAYGDFAYWQSNTKTYPNSVDQNGNSIWGDLCNTPIRHFKFPDCLVSPHQDQDPNIPEISGSAAGLAPFNPARKSKIYPMGIMINAEDVKAWLLYAVQQGWISDAERLSITGYKIVRGNRVISKSIVGKGLIYDMWKYNEYDWVTNSFSSTNSYYSSYPFNDLRPDPYLQRGNSEFQHPYSGTSNNRFAFLSPETTFNGPSIGDELKLEASVFGQATGDFYQVRNHPKYVLLTQSGIDLAIALAAINLTGDLLIALGTLLGQFTVGFSDTIPVGSIVGFVGEFLNLAPKFFIYDQQWRQIILDFGVPKNLAWYYAGVGNYHSSGTLGAIPNAGNKRRIISNSQYLLAGNVNISDNGILGRINNYEREDSVYLFTNGNRFDYTGTTLNDQYLKDTSRFIKSDSTDGQSCRSTSRNSSIASYYGSIKYDMPDQYGDLQDIEWLYTGDCTPIKWEIDQSYTRCQPVFGGDTFISRMTQKRKLPFFLDNPVGTVTNIDFQYRRISNITNSRYYFNSVGESSLNSSSVQLKPVEYYLDCDSSSLYVDGSMYLFSYGIVSFLCESSFNLNYRHASDSKINTFYPFESDIQSWTQEYRVPIYTPNSYLYNVDYSKQNKENVFCKQPIVYHNEPCVTEYKNRVISSLPDSDSDFYTDSWRIYLVNDHKDFPLVNGQLINIKGVEKDKVVLNFENTTYSINAFYTMTTDAGVVQLGAGKLFDQKPNEYVKSDIGHGGTQHHAFVSTKHGHFWVDARRGAVFMLPPSGSNPYQSMSIEEVSLGFRTFFRDNLPFFIQKAFPNYPIDNNFWNVGIALCWDNRFDRLFVTKLDYELLPKWRGIVQYNPSTNTFFIENATDVIPVSLTDATYFCNKSWTIGYSPLTKSWISYYSFIPNYYVGHEAYFQSGINFPQDGDFSKVGIWNHLLTPKSFQVYYGTLYPYVTDVVVKEQLINKQLQSIEYQADYLRFQNDYDYFYNTRTTFNKAVIWGENQNSGILELVPQVPNNMAQGLLYPRTNVASTSVLVSRRTNNWRINQFWDLVADKNNNIPPMILGCVPYMKQHNPLAINYQKPTFKKERFTSDYFTLRLINDMYSNYKIINKWFSIDFIKSYS